MTIEIKVPALGESVTSGILARWKVRSGDTVAKGQPLYDLETDKITSEGLADESGVITLKAAEGATVKIGEVVATIEAGAASEKPATSPTPAHKAEESLKAEMKNADAIATLAGALPALGIVACVLGVVKTMGAIDQPPPVLGALIGGALVGTFLGVFLAYGIFEPFGSRLKQIIDEDGEVLNVAKQIILGNMHGYPVPLIIEAGRVCISHHNQPTFGEIFDALRK